MEIIEKKEICYLFLMKSGIGQLAGLPAKHFDFMITPFYYRFKLKILSGEFTKELSGRYVSFVSVPFVIIEILEYTKELGRQFL